MIKQIPNKILIRYLIAVLLLISIYWQDSLDTIPQVSVSLATFRFIAMVYIILQSIIIIYRFRNDLGFTRSDNIVAVFSNGFNIIVYIALFFLFLKFNGIGVMQFFTSISIVAAAIAIISKEYITAIISGFIISFTKVINIDDTVTIGDISGQVKELKLTKLFLENDQGELIILSNEKVFHSDIINHTKSNRRRVSLKFELATNVEYDIENLEQALISALDEYDEQIKKDSFSLRVENIYNDKISYAFYYTLEKLESELEKSTRKKTLRQLIKFIQSKHQIVPS